MQFRLPDEERVLVGHFASDHRVVTAAEAVAAFMQASPNPRGMQVLLPRKVHPREITGTRAVPQFVGWRYSPIWRGAPPSYRKPPGISRWQWERILDGG